jgi:hypothetical protein
MSNDKPSPVLDRIWQRHPHLLVATNIVLLLFVTITLLTTTDAPVVLYQAF